MKIENMTPKRKARARRLWRKILLVSLVPLIMSIVFTWYGVFFVSIVFSFFAYMMYDYFEPPVDYGPTPWWYFGL